MGDGRILLKHPRDDSFKKSYRMSLISAGSISLDSTFKLMQHCHRQCKFTIISYKKRPFNLKNVTETKVIRLGAKTIPM